MCLDISWQIDWGSVPEWVGGVGSAGGLFLIYVGLRRELKRQQAEEQHSLAAQARLIYATYARTGHEVVEVKVSNVSRGPVFSIKVTPMQLDTANVLRPMSPPPTVSTDDQDRRINSDETLLFVIAAPRGGTLAGMTQVDLHFTDELGNDWLRRDGTGQPERIGRIG